MKRNYKGQPPNPQAAANDSPLHLAFGEALASLQKCPIGFETGKDCSNLQHFGKNICEILDKKVQEYRKTNKLPSSSRPSTIHEILRDDEDEDNGVGGKHAKKGKAPDERVPDEDERPVFKETRNRLYIPEVGSGAHTILTTMYNSMQEPNYPGYMLRKDIISKDFSGWSAMSTLIAKHYVLKVGYPARHSLTDSGVTLARSLIEGRAKHHRDLEEVKRREGYSNDSFDQIIGSEKRLENKFVSTNKSKEGAGPSSKKMDEDEIICLDDDDEDSFEDVLKNYTGPKHDFDDDINEGDNNACSSKNKPKNNSKDMNKPKASSSMSSESDFAKASTSGLRNLENRFSDSDDDDVCKQKYMKDFETNRATFKEPKPTAVNSDDELEAVLARSLPDTKSKKPFAGSSSKSQSKSNAAFEDELKMTLTLSLNESKMKNKVDFDNSYNEYLDDYYNEDAYMNDFNGYNKTQTNSTANQKDEVDEDKEFKRALAISLNESKVNNDIDLDVHNNNFLSDSKEIKTNGITDQDAKMNEDLKTAFAMSMEEAKQREAYSNDSFDQKAPDERVPDEVGNPVFKVTRNRFYKPEIGSGAHTILTTMYNSMQEPNYPGYMLRKDITSKGQKHGDSRMKSNATKNSSGWSAMTTLTAKHYVQRVGNPARYSLTDFGVTLARSLIKGRAQ